MRILVFALMAFAGTWSGRYDGTFVHLTVTPLDANRVNVRLNEVETTGIITPNGTLTFMNYEVEKRGRELVMRSKDREVRLLTPGKICADPGDPQPCADESRHNLPFMLPTDGVARDQFESETFYAVVLKTVPRCSATDDDLAKIQKLFPANKVFATRAGCEDEETISYTNVNADYGFIAVYAGASLEDAREFLKTTKQFPGANLRKMQAVLNYP